MSPKNFNAFVVGSTGEVGKALIKELAKSPAYSNVTLIARKPIDLPKDDEVSTYSKFRSKLVDFDKLSQNHAEDFKGYDVGFCALGTTRGASGADGFVKVDHDYVMATGKLAKEGGCKHFNLVSAGEANKDSWLLYPKVKGEVEEEMKQLDFDRLTIWRPKVLIVDRVESRPIERFFRFVFGVFDRYRFLSIPVPTLAKVMANQPLQSQTSKVEVLTNREIYHRGFEIP